MINFVTSFSEDGFNTYAKQMLESVAEHWSPDFHLTAFYHDFHIKDVDAPQSDRITYRYLNAVEDMVEFKESYANYDGTLGGKSPYNWRQDCIKFCHKVFAITELAFEMADESAEAGWLCWLDADTITNKMFKGDTLAFLDNDHDLYYLGRPQHEYSETSFLAFNLNRQPPLDLLGDLRGAYISGEVLTYREWHDGFVFERLLNIYNAHGLRSVDLTGSEDIGSLVEGKQAFELSPLGSTMSHFKGPKKTLSTTGVSPDVTGPKRYRQLADLIRHYTKDTKPTVDGKKTFCMAETGTWNGGRAIEMALAAFETVDYVVYNGYDLFEEATAELDAAELNSKPHNTLEAVEARLNKFAELMKEREDKSFKFSLNKGDTKHTLFQDPCELDFAYIDGGHSDETVEHDYEMLKATPVIVFDDYFSKDENDKMHEDFLGTNNLFEKFEGRKTILPSNDRVLGGGFTHLCMFIMDDKLPDPPEHLFRQQIVVQPKDSVPKEHIHKNVIANGKMIDKWLEKGRNHKDTAIIVSAGPSTDWEELAEVMTDNPDCQLVCVKHSYPKLLEHGFNPDSCVILDPRPIDGVSTHGVIRKELFAEVSKHTQFLIASMTDNSVTEYLRSKKAHIIGWHAYSQALQEAIAEKGQDSVLVHKDLNIPEGTTLITGGTCAAMRAIGMYHTLGFRDFHLFGFDCSFKREPTKDQLKELSEDGKPKYLQVSVGEDKYWTTGELLAMAQDCEKLFERGDVEMDIKLHGKGSLVNALWDIAPKEELRHYTEFMK